MTGVDTIFALATGPGRSAIAVIRLSGPSTSSVIVALSGRAPKAREARFSVFRDPETGETIDRGLLLWFPAPRSVTGEDYAELQIHGGRAVIDRLLRVLEQMGLRLAEPGEFARRAFLNGKLDLTQLEGLADLIDADTELQRRQAELALDGALRRTVEGWRATIVKALALVEAELDFSDESDVAAPVTALEALLEPMSREMTELMSSALAAERLREGFLVLLLGPPNCGKSTLLNALAKREIAIVSDVAGTTRDMIEVHLDIGGSPVTIVDTAGLRESDDAIERLGVARTKARIEEADLSLWLSEGGAVVPPAEIASRTDVLQIATKADLCPASAECLAISARTGLGLTRLLDEIGQRAATCFGNGGSAALTRERHRRLMEVAEAGLVAAQAKDKPLEFVADDLRGTARALGRLVGAVDVEEVLDAIFAQFCIGK